MLSIKFPIKKDEYPSCIVKYYSQLLFTPLSHIFEKEPSSVIMRYLIFAFLLFTSSVLVAQQHFVEGKINKDCISQPGTFSLEKDQEGISFRIISLLAGKNCYNSLPIKEANFFIKNSSNEIVYSSKSSVKLGSLKLSGGIYKVYVDGGKGAYVKLEYRLKSK